MPETTYVVFHVREVATISEGANEAVTHEALMRLGSASGNVQSALRSVWKSLPADERPGPDAEYVVVPERSLHELKPDVIEEPQLRFRS